SSSTPVDKIFDEGRQPLPNRLPKMRYASFIKGLSERSARAIVPAQILAIFACVTHFFQDGQAREPEQETDVLIRKLLCITQESGHLLLGLSRKRITGYPQVREMLIGFCKPPIEQGKCFQCVSEFLEADVIGY